MSAFSGCLKSTFVKYVKKRTESLFEVDIAEIHVYSSLETASLVVLRSFRKLDMPEFVVVFDR